MWKTSSILLSFIAILTRKIGFAEADECSSKADCCTHLALGLVCCKGYSRDSKRICTLHHCDGQFCFTDAVIVPEVNVV
jgi:hypothetical protein